MEKRKKIEVEGYVHQVSEVIKGKDLTQFFTAVLQEDNKITQLVIFDIHRHNMFHNAEKDK